MARLLGLDIFNRKHDLAKEILRECDASRKIEDLDKKTTMLSIAKQNSKKNKKILNEKKKY